MLAQQSLAELQRHYSQVAADQHSLTRPLADLIPSEPVTCLATTSLRDALTRMKEHAVRSIIVVDEKSSPVGVFTLNDLRDRVVLQALPLETPVSQVMTPDPITLPAEASAAEAIQSMAAGGFHQMIVTAHGKVLGTIFEHDLFALQRVSLRQIHHAIRSVRSIKGLAHVAGDIRNLARNLLAQGVSAEALTRTIAALNDALTREVLNRVLQNHDLEGLKWCWLALGSEGRGEQTLATDQDNALIFAAPAEASDVHRARQGLLAFARDVNAALDELGFPLCKGNIMASNPQWCLTDREWRDQFTSWIREPTPERLLNANIFFDFRPLYGEAALAESLRDWLLARTQDNKLFLRLMVQNALQTEPPLGLIRAFQVSDEPGSEGTLDLKKRGARIFVDAARVFALALGSRFHRHRRPPAARGRERQGRSAARRGYGRRVSLPAGSAAACAGASAPGQSKPCRAVFTQRGRPADAEGDFPTSAQAAAAAEGNLLVRTLMCGVRELRLDQTACAC